MKNDEFFNMCQKYCDKCLDLMGQKGDEYSRNNDKLHNFKSAGKMLNCTPEKALIGFLTKHLISIIDYTNDLDVNIKHSCKSWDEKIQDTINYMLLLRALLHDREKNETDI